MTDTVKRHVYVPERTVAIGEERSACAECAAPEGAAQHLAAVELSETGRNWHRQLRDLDRQLAAVKTNLIEPLEAQRAIAVRNLQAELGDAEAATIGGRPVVTWVASKPGDGIDLGRLKAEYPDLYTKLYKPAKAARPFKVQQ